jgi:hypothetical protein
MQLQTVRRTVSSLCESNKGKIAPRLGRTTRAALNHLWIVDKSTRFAARRANTTGATATIH